MQCPKCLQTVADGSATCPHCGASLTPAAAGDFFKRPGEVQSGAPISTGSAPAPTPAPAPAPAANQCPACGATLVAGAKFCRACGAPVSAAPEAPAGLSDSGMRINMGKVQTQPAAPAAPAAPTAPATPAAAGSGAGLAVSYLRGVCASPVYMMAALLYTLAAAVSLYVSFDAYNQMSPMLPYMSNDIKSTMMVSMAYAVVPTVCVMLGLWVLLSATKKSGPTLSTGGLTILEISAIISIVLQVVLFFMIVGMISESISDSYSYSYDYYSGARTMADYTSTLVIVFLALFIIPAVIYRVKIFTMSYGAAKAVREGGLPPVPSDYVGVMAVFSGVICFAFLFFIFMPAQDMAGGDAQIPTSIYLTMILGGVSSILMGALTSAARKQWIRHMVR